MKCPVCHKEVDFKSEEMPFCSARCRVFDLADWATDQHVISSPASGHQLEDELEWLDSNFGEPGSGRVQ